VSDEYGRLQVALIPSLPEQEAEAEAARLAGAANLPEPQQGTSWADPVDTTPHGEVDLQGGDSFQIPSRPPGQQGASDESHQHYYIHTITETIDRGYYGFNSVAWNLPKGVPIQILGLDDNRPRTEIELLAQGSDGTAVYIGDRDVINSDYPQGTGIWLGTAFGASEGDTSTEFTYYARKELWAISVGDDATLGVTSYTSEPNSDETAKRSKSGAGAR